MPVVAFSIKQNRSKASNFINIMKHIPFKSVLKPNYEVVEQRQGNLRLYPHTDQLPVLLRALNWEFNRGLPDGLANIKDPSKHDRKFPLYTVATVFCDYVHADRKDQLRLFPLLDHNLITKIAIIQQVSEDTVLGKTHRFRFHTDNHTDNSISSEIYLSGKQVVFTDHALKQFSLRTADYHPSPATSLASAFFSSPIVAMSIKYGRGFVIPFRGSILALTFQETNKEFILTTCLTIKELVSLEYDDPPLTFNLHYGASFSPPKTRNWSPKITAEGLYECWKKRVPFAKGPTFSKDDSWHGLADRIWKRLKEKNRTQTPIFVLQDNIPGPVSWYLSVKPGQARTAETTEATEAPQLPTNFTANKRDP